METKPEKEPARTPSSGSGQPRHVGQAIVACLPLVCALFWFAPGLPSLAARMLGLRGGLQSAGAEIQPLASPPRVMRQPASRECHFQGVRGTMLTQFRPTPPEEAIAALDRAHQLRLAGRPPGREAADPGARQYDYLASGPGWVVRIYNLCLKPASEETIVALAVRAPGGSTLLTIRIQDPPSLLEKLGALDARALTRELGSLMPANPLSAAVDRVEHQTLAAATSTWFLENRSTAREAADYYLAEGYAELPTGPDGSVRQRKTEGGLQTDLYHFPAAPAGRSQTVIKRTRMLP